MSAVRTSAAPSVLSPVAHLPLFLTVKEYAREARASVTTVKRDIARGRLRSLKRSPRCVLIPRAELERLLGEAA